MMRCALLLTMLVTGCGLFGDSGGGDDGGGDAAVVASSAKAPGSAGGSPLTRLDKAIAAQADYVYNPIGKRDPFRSFLSLGGNRIEDETPRTPLQRYEIDDYRLVGIIWGIDRPRALVEDPDNVGHVMEIGTYIGKNWGKVTQITSSEVVVTEEYQTIDGELVVNPIRLALPGQRGRL